jgi:hypothetical protein
VIDDEVVRDSVVYRMAQGKCCAPFCESGRPRQPYSFAEELPELSLTVASVRGSLRRYDYPCCGLTICEAWLVAQELMGRLPHQSTAVPRARWVAVGDGWVLEAPGAEPVVVRPHGNGWAATYGQRTSYTWHTTLQSAQEIVEYTVAEILLGRRTLSGAPPGARWVEVDWSGQRRGWNLVTSTELLAYVSLDSVSEIPGGIEERWNATVWLQGVARVARLRFGSRYEARLWAEREVTREPVPGRVAVSRVVGS